MDTDLKLLSTIIYCLPFTYSALTVTYLPPCGATVHALNRKSVKIEECPVPLYWVSLILANKRLTTSYIFPRFVTDKIFPLTLMLFLAKATTPYRFRPSVVPRRTLWTVDCTTTAPSTQLSAATWDVITATDSGSLANNRRVRVTQFYCHDL